MCVASDSTTIVVVMLLFVENEYEIGKTVRSLGVSGVTLYIYGRRKGGLGGQTHPQYFSWEGRAPPAFGSAIRAVKPVY